MRARPRRGGGHFSLSLAALNEAWLWSWLDVPDRVPKRAPRRRRHQAAVPFRTRRTRCQPLSAALSCCHRAAIKPKARSPSPATEPFTCTYLVAGAGFEPATSGL
jgi:hypothetical protein